MSIRNTLALAALSAVMAIPAGLAQAEFPDKPIQLLIGFRPGGAVDTTARLLAKNMEKELGVPVVAVEKAGGGGTVMAATLIHAKPDGYTIGMGASAAYTLAPQINSKITYKIDDFDHVATVSIPQDAMVVPINSPWNTLDDMIADAKANDKTLSLASQVAVSRMAAIAIAKKSGVKFNVIPVKGGSKGIQQVLGGHVDMTWSGSGWHAQVKAGTMKPLFSVGDKRNEGYPDLPTLKELGYDYAFTDTFMLSAPKGVPAELMAKLSAAVEKSLTPELKAELFAKMKLSVDYRNSADTTAFLKRQYADVEPLVAAMHK